MRQKRSKAYRKLMNLYSISFGFRQPYQVLVDAEMCRTATNLKLELVKQLATVLQGDIKPMITQCCIHELYIGGKSQQAAVDLAKTFERRKCNHREAIPSDECLTSVVGDTNKHRYVIASQSQPLRVHLRGIAGVPIVHINRSVMVLEPPSDLTIKKKEEIEAQALLPKPTDISLVDATKLAKVVSKKQKRPKGPNPLSVKKKAPPPQSLTHSPFNAGEKRKSGAVVEEEIEISDQKSKRRKRRRKASSNVID